MKCFSPCPRGLESVLAQELATLNCLHIETTAGGVSFQGEWQHMYAVNLHSRIASRVLLEVATGHFRTEDDIYRLVLNQKWEQWFSPDASFRVDTTAVLTNLKNSAFITLKTKDAVCDRMRQKFNRRPNVNTVNPDARIYLYLFRDSVTVYIDTSGEALFKRGWRTEKGDAPLRENLAAGLLAMAGWKPGVALFDPMCGSGTLLIEAAQQCLGIPAGLSRHFGFENFRGFNLDFWQTLKTEATPSPRDTPLYLSGSDISGDMVDIARNNLKRAGIYLDLPIKQVEAQFARVDQNAYSVPGIVNPNQPYGSRISVRGDTTLSNDERYQQFFSEFASQLKQNFAGWQVHILSADRDLPRLLRLKESRKLVIFNGAIECRLFRFDMVTGGNRGVQNNAGEVQVAKIT